MEIEKLLIILLSINQYLFRVNSMCSMLDKRRQKMSKKATAFKKPKAITKRNMRAFPFKTGGRGIKQGGRQISK